MPIVSVDELEDHLEEFAEDSVMHIELPCESGLLLQKDETNIIQEVEIYQPRKSQQQPSQEDNSYRGYRYRSDFTLCMHVSISLLCMMYTVYI